MQKTNRDKPEVKYVTWAALVSLLGGFAAFFLILLVEAFNELEDDAGKTVDRMQKSILHIDTETRKDVREVRDDLQSHVQDQKRHFKPDDELKPPVIDYPEGFDPNDQ